MQPNEALILLNLIPGIGPIRVRQLLDQYPEPSAIFSRPAAELARLPGIGHNLATTLLREAKKLDVKQELEQTARAGVRIITLLDPDYPPALRDIYDPPICLYVRGRAEILSRPRSGFLAVVGSRRTSRYGEAMAQRLTRGASMAGWVIVSGLARGIDTASHRACLQAGGRTVAVLGGGLGSIYPPENLDLAREIAETGVLISEHPMMMKPERRTFPMRNRIISGLSQGVLVVEAGVKSGSLITAKQALEQGRQVMAVPGHADSPLARGCHALIKDGAALIETVDDILETFSFLPNLERRGRKTSQNPDQTQSQETDHGGQARPVVELTKAQQQIVTALARGGRTVEQLTNDLSMPVGTLLAELIPLELKRLVRQLPGKHYELSFTEKS